MNDFLKNARFPLEYGYLRICIYASGQSVAVRPFQPNCLARQEPLQNSVLGPGPKVLTSLLDLMSSVNLGTIDTWPQRCVGPSALVVVDP